MSLQLFDNKLLLVGGSLATDPDCCCDGDCCQDQTSIEVEVNFSGAGGCCLECQSLYGGAHTLPYVGSCFWQKVITAASAICATDGSFTMQTVACVLTVAMPSTGAFSIAGGAEVEYDSPGTTTPHFRNYAFSRQPCTTSPVILPFDGSVAFVKTGTQIYTPPACSVSFEITAVNP